LAAPRRATWRRRSGAMLDSAGVTRGGIATRHLSAPEHIALAQELQGIACWREVHGGQRLERGQQRRRVADGAQRQRAAATAAAAWWWRRVSMPGGGSDNAAASLALRGASW
jgi:hypothetical protein